MDNLGAKLGIIGGASVLIWAFAHGVLWVGEEITNIVMGMPQ